MDQPDKTASYWSRPADEMLAAMGSSRDGLSAGDAAERLQHHGPNLVAEDRQRKVLRLFLDRFRSPLILILIFAALVAVVVHDWLDALVVLGIIIISAVLSSIQEYRASNAVEKLRRRVAAKATVLRDGHAQVMSIEAVVPGDVVQLSAGSLVPADGILLEAKDFFVTEALLTGETFPAEKQPGLVGENAGLAERSNCVFMGTSARSGTATALIVHTGRETAYGQIAGTLALRPPETELDRGLRRFGGLLISVMLTVVVTVLAVNILLHRPTIDTLLFAMALAVGLSPELLPAILTVTLARGAQNMAKLGVIVRRLNSIENLGSMDILCTDKTGTLTAGIVQLDGALGSDGQQSEKVLRLSYANSRLQTGLANPLDDAIVTRAETAGLSIAGYQKLDEIPYDFVRKRMSVLLATREPGDTVLITKGALQNVLEVCDRVEKDEDVEFLDDATRSALMDRFAAWSEQGYRVLGVAQKSLSSRAICKRDDEQEMVFAGFLLFFDPPEPGVRTTLDALRRLGVELKIITGDNRLVARHVAEAVGLSVGRIVTGPELAQMKDEALWHLAPGVTLFAEVDPNQKERIILALQKMGHVVGYLGDGINDAPALHAADVGISVDKAADVAKEAADFVMLERGLGVVQQGIDEGRHTFANTLKYIFITTSANFGNMISMAMASMFLPFLPMLARQILLNNFLSDVPAMGIAGDNVDREWASTPHRWDIRLIRRFMISFGLLSTVFDVVTFGVLVYLVRGSPELFRTGWFVESLLTELFILFVLRTYRPFYKSRPGRWLLWSALAVVVLTVLLPFLPFAALFGFVPLPAPVMAAVLGITAVYVVVSELTKQVFYARATR